MSNYNKICTVIVSISVMILHYCITMVVSQSLEEAKKGLENTPQKTVFEYKINEELNEEEREDMIYEIAEIPE